MKDVLLTTVDNPYNPHTDYYNWFIWDTAHHYNTLQKISTESYDDDSMSDEEHDEMYDLIMNEIINNDDLGIYCLIEPDDDVPIDRQRFEENMKNFIESSK